MRAFIKCSAELNKAQGFIFAVQEPNVTFGKLTCINGSINIFDSSPNNVNKVRAALVISRNMNAWPVKEFMTPDLAVAKILLPGQPCLYIVSLYADGKKAAIPRNLKMLVAKVKIEGAHILIMGDSNAHSQDLWNGKRTCERGKAWEQFVLDEQLAVGNVGDYFTFNTRKGQSIMTLQSSLLALLGE